VKGAAAISVRRRVERSDVVAPFAARRFLRKERRTSLSLLQRHSARGRSTACPARGRRALSRVLVGDALDVGVFGRVTGGKAKGVASPRLGQPSRTKFSNEVGQWDVGTAEGPGETLGCATTCSLARRIRRRIRRGKRTRRGLANFSSRGSFAGPREASCRPTSIELTCPARLRRIPSPATPSSAKGQVGVVKTREMPHPNSGTCPGEGSVAWPVSRLPISPGVPRKPPYWRKPAVRNLRGGERRRRTVVATRAKPEARL
jgi:hypothetical protein